MSHLVTTLRWLRDANACAGRYAFLCSALGPGFGDEETLPLSCILDLNGLDDALWALNNVGPNNAQQLLRLVACDFAEHVLPQWTAKYPDDVRSLMAIMVARRYAFGLATGLKLRDAEWAAEWASWAAARAAEERVWQVARLRRYLDEPEEMVREALSRVQSVEVADAQANR